MAAEPGIVTSGTGPPNAVVEVQPGLNVQPVVLVDQNGNYLTGSGSAATAGYLADLTGVVNVSASAAPSTGQVLTATGGSAATWQNSQSGFSNPMTALGDVITGGTAGAPQRLGIGSAGQALTVVGGVPAWVTGGSVQTVTAGNTSIVIGGTATAPTITTGTLDVIATQEPPAGNWSNNGHKITGLLANGSGTADAATYGQTLAGGALGPLTTKGDTLYANATPAPARLAAGSVNSVLTVAGGLPVWGTGMTLLATTGGTGYTLINGTGNAVSWTAPNDGAMHRVLVFATLHVISAQTAGAVEATLTLPDGTSNNKSMFAGGLSSNEYYSSGPATFLIEANTSLSVYQNSAQTGGTAVIFAELWGS